MYNRDIFVSDVVPTLVVCLFVCLAIFVFSGVGKTLESEIKKEGLVQMDPRVPVEHHVVEYQTTRVRVCRLYFITTSPVYFAR